MMKEGGSVWFLLKSASGFQDSHWKRRLRIHTAQPEAVAAVLQARKCTSVQWIAKDSTSQLQGLHALEVILYRLEVMEWTDRIRHTDPLAVVDVLPIGPCGSFQDLRPGGRRHADEQLADVSKYGNELSNIWQKH
ncbi:hypothetical protein [Paenibacillus sp. HJGM_3]|uniref:hypothetical protein n=1 Tax=Paenibacillus sp. HJGM_3 TaxID=3379816 RepID=UPI00385F3E0A